MQNIRFVDDLNIKYVLWNFKFSNNKDSEGVSTTRNYSQAKICFYFCGGDIFNLQIRMIFT